MASSLSIVLGISLLMELVELSPALGAFLGGVVLAAIEFKHELESTLDPFKGLLPGLFFMTVGASINFIVIGENPLLIGGLVVGVILLKVIVLYVVGLISRLKMDQRLLLVVGLAQIGEFAFVMLSCAFQLKIFEREQLDILLVVTALSMTLNKVILLGFGHFGSTVGRFLRAHGVSVTILDNDSNRVDFLRQMTFDKETTDGQAEKFIKLDVERPKRLAVTSKDEKEYIFRSKKELSNTKSYWSKT